MLSARLSDISTFDGETAPFRPGPSGVDAVESPDEIGVRDRWPGSGKQERRAATDTSLIGWATMTDDVNDKPEFETVVELLDDEFAREILAFTSTEPMTVTEISDRSEAAPSTLYRRVERLQEAELLVEQSRIRSDGHHDTVYAAALEHVQISLANGEFTVRIDRRKEDAADRLRRLWGDL